MAKSIKVVRAALDEAGNDIVIRGVVDPQCLAQLQVADYQREQLAEPKIRSLMKAIREGRVPDIDLGMRGSRVTERDGSFLLRDDVYIVDGYQRVTAGLRLMQEVPPFTPHIGAVVHLDTTEEWEHERFEALNLGQTKLSPNVTLRNQREKFRVVETLWRLSHDPESMLNGRVTWSQARKSGELLSATMVLHTMGRLHAHVGAGKYNDVIAACEGVQRIADRLGTTVFEANVQAFFEIIEQAWGIRRVAYREGAIYLRTTFLRAFAHLLSDHLDFWQGEQLTMPVPMQRKLGTFAITDPYVRGLASAGGSAMSILINLFVQHLETPSRKLRQRLATKHYEDDDEAID